MALFMENLFYPEMKQNWFVQMILWLLSRLIHGKFLLFSQDIKTIVFQEYDLTNIVWQNICSKPLHIANYYDHLTKIF